MHMRIILLDKEFTKYATNKQIAKMQYKFITIITDSNALPEILQWFQHC